MNLGKVRLRTKAKATSDSIQYKSLNYTHTCCLDHVTPPFFKQQVIINTEYKGRFRNLTRLFPSAWWEAAVLIAILYRKQKMHSLQHQRQARPSQESRRSSFDPKDFPLPVLAHKRSKFASDADSDSVHSEHYPTVIKPKLAKLVENEVRSEQAYWGKVKPYWFDPQTNTPRVTVTPHFLRSLLINLLIITVICVAVPVLTNRNMFSQSLTPSGHNRLLQEGVGERRVLAGVSTRYVARKYSIYIFSAAWTGYEVAFLLVLLLGNPGYGDPLAQKQLSLEDQQEILQFPQRRAKQGYGRCSTCHSIVDNSVFHCPECDLCCEGFTHHCEWIGKCVGYRSEVFLNAYYYGFFLGTVLLVLLILLQSIPYQ